MTALNVPPVSAHNPFRSPNLTPQPTGTSISSSNLNPFLAVDDSSLPRAHSLSALNTEDGPLFFHADAGEDSSDDEDDGVEDLPGLAARFPELRIDDAPPPLPPRRTSASSPSHAVQSTAPGSSSALGSSSAHASSPTALTSSVPTPPVLPPRPRPSDSSRSYAPPSGPPPPHGRTAEQAQSQARTSPRARTSPQAHYTPPSGLPPSHLRSPPRLHAPTPLRAPSRTDSLGPPPGSPPTTTRRPHSPVDSLAPPPDDDFADGGSFDLPPAYTTTADTRAGEETIDVGPRRPFQRAPPVPASSVSPAPSSVGSYRVGPVAAREGGVATGSYGVPMGPYGAGRVRAPGSSALRAIAAAGAVAGSVGHDSLGVPQQQQRPRSASDSRAASSSATTLASSATTPTSTATTPASTATTPASTATASPSSPTAQRELSDFARDFYAAGAGSASTHYAPPSGPPPARSGTERDAGDSASSDARASASTNARTSPSNNARTSPSNNARTSPSTNAHTSPSTNAHTSPSTNAHTSPSTNARTSTTGSNSSSNTPLRGASDVLPTTRPTPGRPLLNGGYTLEYPVGYMCPKCRNTGWKRFGLRISAVGSSYDMGCRSPSGRHRGVLPSSPQPVLALRAYHACPEQAPVREPEKALSGVPDKRRYCYVRSTNVVPYPQHPCRRCWQRFSKPFTQLLALASWGSPDTRMQRPLPSFTPPQHALMPPTHRRVSSASTVPSSPIERLGQRLDRLADRMEARFDSTVQRTPSRVLQAGPFARPPPGTVMMRPGDPRLGGRLCWRCHGRGRHSFMLFDEITCEECGGLGRTGVR
ncbi:hypothetical protein K488DRAFT_70229 [Vararia minispora EC-137]|uniref:Uncharacterized protein n=1 Tax=Vararia minispora EC-137 TaxID=1314806 RepID=A0ACB8QMB3_9AGAM|nr:hypothetical protein K488DRAFT_70229 [Vararia minispora EC-137]